METMAEQSEAGNGKYDLAALPFQRSDWSKQLTAEIPSTGSISLTPRSTLPRTIHPSLKPHP
jgi:hypothetical protein